MQQVRQLHLSKSMKSIKACQKCSQCLSICQWKMMGGGLDGRWSFDGSGSSFFHFIPLINYSWLQGTLQQQIVYSNSTSENLSEAKFFTKNDICILKNLLKNSVCFFLHLLLCYGEAQNYNASISWRFFGKLLHARIFFSWKTGSDSSNNFPIASFYVH